jgi:hypothetical protein
MRRLVLLLATLALSGGVAACGGSNGPDAGNTVNNGQLTTQTGAQPLTTGSTQPPTGATTQKAEPPATTTPTATTGGTVGP